MIHWFVWVLIILLGANVGQYLARTAGWEPRPTNPWIGLLLEGLLLAGVIAYLT